jgi:hypothetical protein
MSKMLYKQSIEYQELVEKLAAFMEYMEKQYFPLRQSEWEIALDEAVSEADSKTWIKI